MRVGGCKEAVCHNNVGLETRVTGDNKRGRHGFTLTKTTSSRTGTRIESHPITYCGLVFLARGAPAGALYAAESMVTGTRSDT